MTNISIDTSELDALASDLQQLPPKVTRGLPAVVRKGAVNIKNDWREAAAKSRHFKIAPTISFDEKAASDGFEAEIGPNRHYRAARLAGIAHFGGVNGGGGTIGDPQRFADAEEPGFAKAVADLVGDLL
ncbi:MAG TPA: hypothetical protein GXZ60_09575 [Intrasporangiaceae bacterium]|nr:hypothetical protein [Intrasporangiaceae bacterium]